MSTETALSRAVRSAIRTEWPKAWVIKAHGSTYSSSGVPDLLVCLKGRLVALELKQPRPGETDQHARDRCSLMQVVQILGIRDAGGIGACVVSVEEALEVLWWVSDLDTCPDAPMPVPDPSVLTTYQQRNQHPRQLVE